MRAAPSAFSRAILAVAVLIIACSKESSTPTSNTPATTPTPTNTVVAIASVTISPGSETILLGDGIKFTATARDASGNALSGRVFDWTTSDSTVMNGTQNANTATLMTLSGGTTTITATSEGKSGSSTITVFAPSPPPSASTVVSYLYYKRGDQTQKTATLTIPSGDPFGTGTLSLDGKSFPGIYTVGGLAGGECFAGLTGNVITSCWSPALSPQVMLLCGPDPVTAAPNTLLYVLFNTPDAFRAASTAPALLNALQSGTEYIGIGVYARCGSAQTAWIRNYPLTNYYYWPDVVSTYTPAYVANLLAGAVIFSTPNAGNNFNSYVALRISAGVFEVWH